MKSATKMADKEGDSEKNSEKRPGKEPRDPKLDFSSDEFDPLLALYTPKVSVPDPKAKKYDNLAAYQSAMEREKNPKRNEKKKEVVASTSQVTIERRWLPHQMPIPTRRSRRLVKNVFTKMDNMKGPLALLKKCVEERLKIKVYTKNELKTRGYCLAYVVAFDKHFNLALEDVTEVWTRRKKKKVPALDSAISARKFKFQRQFTPPDIEVTPHPTKKKLENCSRYVEQIMLRGEHVVLISVPEERKSDERK